MSNDDIFDEVLRGGTEVAPAEIRRTVFDLVARVKATELDGSAAVLSAPTRFPRRRLMRLAVAAAVIAATVGTIAVTRRDDDRHVTAMPETTTSDSPGPSPVPNSVEKPSGCTSDPPFHATVLPTGFDDALKMGRAHQIPWDTPVMYYSGAPGAFIDIYPSELLAWRPATVVPLTVLNTTGQFGEVEDGYSASFLLPCGPYTLLSSGVTADDFKAVIAGLTVNQCSWRASVARQDGAGQHSASVFSLTNVSVGPCAVPALVGVRAVADDGTLLADGTPGGFFTVESLDVESIGVGERSDFVLTTTSQEFCGKTAQVLSTTVRVTLKDGDPLSVTFPWTLNVACGLQFSEATRWSD